MTTDHIPLGDLIDRLRRLDMERAAVVYLKVGVFSFPIGDISAINHAVTLHAYDEEGGMIEVNVVHDDSPYGRMFYALQAMALQTVEMIRNHAEVSDYNERGAAATQAERVVESLQALIGLLKLFELGEHH